MAMTNRVYTLRYQHKPWSDGKPKIVVMGQTRLSVERYMQHLLCLHPNEYFEEFFSIEIVPLRK
jgi:hypothetical protein